jgi:Glycosyltransferase 61
MTALPAIHSFRDVPVVPVTRVTRMKGHGGPIWPHFAAEVAARHCRNGIPGDKAPARPARLRPEPQAAVWGGFLAPQFGHLVAEHLTRLPQSLLERPDDLYLFTVPPGETAETLPDYVWDVLDWHGLRRERCRIITEPCLVQTLRVAAQGEMLGKVPPRPAFIDLLDANARRNALVPEVNRVVYVSRAGMAAKGMGGHAGEGYLASLLHRCGVRVVDPAILPIRRQMEIYAGAEVLIFAEGSALHGRCLLGRVAQDIHVLRRRPLRNTASVQLAARCRRLAYHEVVGGSLGTRTATRASRADLELALYDSAALLAVLRDLGIDLGSLWDTDAALAATRSDTASWLASNPTDPAQLAENHAVLAALGLAVDHPDAASSLPLATALP